MDITHSFEEMKLQEKNQKKNKNKYKVQVGVAPPTRGVGHPSYKKTQLDHDI